MERPEDLSLLLVLKELYSDILPILSYVYIVICVI